MLELRMYRGAFNTTDGDGRRPHRTWGTAQEISFEGEGLRAYTERSVEDNMSSLNKPALGCVCT
jgi:hypothetical protein